MTRRDATTRSEQVRRGWETRRKASNCAECGKVAKLYAVVPIRETRDLCIDCAWALCEAAT